MKFNPEEINLCEQIAEKYKKEIKCGDWILKNDKLVLNLDGKLAWSEDGKQDIIITITSKLEVTPLWTISDCLEFLRERNFEVSLCYFNKFSGYRIQIWKPEKTQAFYSDYDLDRSMEQCTHKTPLEACLKAVLAVLEESNG